MPATIIRITYHRQSWQESTKETMFSAQSKICKGLLSGRVLTTLQADKDADIQKNPNNWLP